MSTSVAWAPSPLRRVGAVVLAVAGLVVPHHRLLSQAGTVTGAVYETRTGRPVIAATIKIEGTTQVAQTDPRGQFVFRNVAGTALKLTATRVGYQPKTVDA